MDSGVNEGKIESGKRLVKTKGREVDGGLIQEGRKGSTTCKKAERDQVGALIIESGRSVRLSWI